jgi:glutamine synthetase
MTENLQKSMEKIQGMLLIAHENNHDNARFVCDKILPEMSLVRQISDQIEESIPSDIWPLPTYTEMLFIR